MEAPANQPPPNEGETKAVEQPVRPAPSGDPTVTLAEPETIKEYLISKDFFRQCMGEMIGTFLLVFIACGSCTVHNDAGAVVRIALSFGITVASIAQAIGHISGCHLNPAVTVGLVVVKLCSPCRAVCYIIAQFIGGFLGAIVLFAASDKKSRQNMGCTIRSKNYTASEALAIEALITFVLVLVVCGVCDKYRSDIKGSAPLAIGFSITAGHLFAANKTGASMNTARTFGPNLVSYLHCSMSESNCKEGSAGTYCGKVPGLCAGEDLWIYFIGPPLGGILAGFAYRFLFAAEPAPPPPPPPEVESKPPAPEPQVPEGGSAA